MVKNKGFSFVETIIAVSIFVLVLAAASQFFRPVSLSWETDKRLNVILQDARASMDKITEELKYTNEIIGINDNYVEFGTSGEEYYLDDMNAGYSTTGTWEDGTLQGGYAGDYDRSNAATSTAYYRFNPVVEGAYDVYSYFIATSTNTDQARYWLYDTGGSSYSTSDVNQRTGGAPSWYKIWDSNTVSLSTAGTRLEIWSTGLGGAGTNWTIADGVKLVYKGYRQKVFSYNSTNRSIHFKQNRTGAGAGSAVGDAQANLLIGPLSAANTEKLPTIYPVSGINIFTYYEMDGTTATTSTMNVALIRITYEIRDPDAKVPAYKLSSEVRRAVSPSSRRIIINEINYMPPLRSIVFDSFDGMTGGMDNKNYGFSTVLTDGWESFNDDLTHAQDPDGGTWVYNWAGSVNYTITNVNDGGDRVISYAGSVSGNQDITSRLWIIERSQNYTLQANFKVSATGGNDADPQFGFYLRFVDANNYVKVDSYNGTAPDTNQYLRVRIVDAGVVKWNTTSVIPALVVGTEYPIRIDDTLGKIRVTFNGTVYFSGVEYNTNSEPPNTTNNICNVAIGNKGIYSWSNSVLYFDDIVITSFDFKPVAITSNFDAPFNNAAASCQTTAAGSNNYTRYGGWVSATNQGACVTTNNWRRGIATQGPGAGLVNPNRDHTPWTALDYSWATNLTGNYSDADATTALSFTSTCLLGYAGHICLSTLANDNADSGNINNIWVFTSGISARFWQYLDFPGVADNDDAEALAYDIDTDTNQNDFLKWAEYAIFPITAGMNYNANPSSYDGNRSAAFTEFWADLRSWREIDHPNPPVAGGWAQLRAAILPTMYRRNLRPAFRWQTTTTGGVAYGIAIDDVEISGGGVWQRGTPSGATNPLPPSPYSDPNVWGTRLDWCYCNYLSATLETPVMDLADLTADDITVISFQMWRVLESGDWDGVVLEISNDSANNYQSWTQVTNVLISSKETSDDASYDYTGNIPGSYCNEGAGKNAWRNTDNGWKRVYIRVGNTYNGQKIKFRFHIFSDDSYPEGNHGAYLVAPNQYRGFFIDDFEVYALPDPRLEYIELYNPTPFSVDVNNWRLYTNTHPGSGDDFDTIQNDAVNGCGTTIAPYGYAVITNINTNSLLYDLDDRWCYGGETEPCETPGGSWQPACSSSAVRLQIDDNYFGRESLTDDYGSVKLTDSSGNLVDYVQYNTVFYDNMETSLSTTTIWSNNYFSGNTTRWWIANPIAATPGTGIDHTKGQWGDTTGKCWVTGTSTPAQETYSASARADLRTPALDIRGTSATNPATFEYWQWVDTENIAAGDGGLLQISQTGASNFTENDFTDVVTNTIISPTYNGTIAEAANVLNGRSAFYLDTATAGNAWTKIKVDLTDYAGKIIMMRFYFGADGTGGAPPYGWYIDDAACYFDWGGKGNFCSLQRRSYKGDSCSYGNWADSPFWGTPAAVNTW